MPTSTRGTDPIRFGVVIAVAKNSGPATVGHFHDRRLTEGVPQVLIVSVGEFPEYQLSGITLAKSRWISHIESKKALAAFA